MDQQRDDDKIDERDAILLSLYSQLRTACQVNAVIEVLDRAELVSRAEVDALAEAKFRELQARIAAASPEAQGRYLWALLSDDEPTH